MTHRADADELDAYTGVFKRTTAMTKHTEVIPSKSSIRNIVPGLLQPHPCPSKHLELFLRHIPQHVWLRSYRRLGRSAWKYFCSRVAGRVGGGGGLGLLRRKEAAGRKQVTSTGPCRVSKRQAAAA